MRICVCVCVCVCVRERERISVCEALYVCLHTYLSNNISVCGLDQILAVKKAFTHVLP